MVNEQYITGQCQSCLRGAHTPALLRNYNNHDGVTSTGNQGHKHNNICVADVALISKDSWPCEMVIFKQTVTSHSSENESMHVL